MIAISDICTAMYPNGVIGSKVTDEPRFMGVLIPAVKAYDFESARVPGQGFICINEASPYVSAGVGLMRDDPAAYVLRSHRGRVGAYLKREYAAETKTCNAVVYTTAAYLSDPDITKEEYSRIVSMGDVTHVLVAVLASAGEASTLSPYRFVANLAGGNKEALVWTGDEIRAKAREIAGYTNEWSTVAD